MGLLGLLDLQDLSESQVLKAHLDQWDLPAHLELKEISALQDLLAPTDSLGQWEYQVSQELMVLPAREEAQDHKDPPAVREAQETQDQRDK